MFKIKPARTADVVVAGFRYHKDGPIVGSLLLGLYGDDGQLHHVGVSASFSRERRTELVEELARYREPIVDHPWLGDHGDPETQRRPGAVSRWTGKKNLDWVPL